jgi:misacylated tRNA(Ala) deacylase
MTEQLYQTDSYIREFEALVTAVEGQAVALDRTAFYPGGGGQPHDTGTLAWQGGSQRVVKVQKRGADVWHTLEGEVPQAGTAVRASLDWERRYQLMRTHTALHVLCGVVWRDYGALGHRRQHGAPGGTHGLSSSRPCERSWWPRSRPASTPRSRKQHPVRVAILPREVAFQIPDLIRTKINLLPPQIQEVRTVEIVGLDLQADGGTHVASTGEVGRVRVVDYKSKGAINKRIYIQLEQ